MAAPRNESLIHMNPAMTSQRWRRIEELFRAAIDRPAADRDLYLTLACRGDEELRREVLSLISRDTAEDFIRDPIVGAAMSVTAGPEDELTGQRIGPYRVTRLIGRGGMGAVYEAERDDEQFKQQVALKIIKRGMDTDYLRDRFLIERRILASLDHPHIARLFDGGATVEGLPYFVMELIAGDPITIYCRRSELPLNEKLSLFRSVCSAVQHAHQNLIVHRDLKPSNILITEEGAPKLLDFGIAKLLSPDGRPADAQTQTGLRMMTPEYASPEQASGQAVATTTDVYSLGVVLYELLTERRPHQFKTASPADPRQLLWETEIEAPSQVVARELQGAGKLARRLAGDLDNIVMMAMRKEPERRYQSVEQFSEDIRRYLAGLPVAARKDTFGYRMSKFARRNKAGVVILALLVVLAVVLAIQTARIAQERDRANQEAAAARAMTESLAAMFEFADPGKARGNTITARELLDQGTEKVLRELDAQPAAQAKLMVTIGQMYQSIGLYDRSQALLEEALQLRRRTLGQQHPDVAASVYHLAMAAKLDGDYARSESLHREALAMRRKLLGNQHRDVAQSLDELGSLLVDRGNFNEAEILLREPLALRRKLFGDEHSEVAESLTSLGRLMTDTGKLKEAESYYRQAFEMRRRLFGVEHPLTAGGMNNLAAVLQEAGDYKAAEALFRDALTIRRKLLDPEHPDLILSMANLASVCQDARKYDEAEQLYRETLTLRRKLLGEDHPKLAVTMNNLATLLRDQGKYDEAESLFRQSMALRRKHLGENHAEVGSSLYNIATLLSLQGQHAEAEKMYRQAIEVYQKSLTPDHWLIHRSRSSLGASQTKLKRYREAEAELLTAFAGLKAALGDEHLQTQKAVSHLIELYDSWGKPEKVDSYRALSRVAPDQSKK
jgi:serine/threonine protein kinase/tetratricopeptide (TPR) repeat protein